MRLRIDGGFSLQGCVKIEGAKNAVLPILAGALLCKGRIVLHSVPKIADITNMLRILSSLGCRVNIRNDTVKIDIGEITCKVINKEAASRIRGSIFIMGALLAKTGGVKIPYPGGCAIGARPIDIHISALKEIGAKIKENKDYIECTLPKQKPVKTVKTLFLDFPSVGATENIILAVALGNRNFKIVGAAKEPELADLCNFLNKCGADITGAGTDIITIRGVPVLHGTEYTPIPDRINTGSYLIAATAAGGNVTLHNVIPSHNANLIAKLKSMGAKITARKNSLQIICTRNKKKRTDRLNIHTAPYPGFPTDLQSQFAALSSAVNGTTVITENLFENRFMCTEELRKLGADITINGKCAVINGTGTLSAETDVSLCPASYGVPPNRVCEGLRLFAKDLRGGAALVIAALAASGVTTIENAEYIYRGHSNIVRDLTQLGANIIRID